MSAERTIGYAFSQMFVLPYFSLAGAVISAAGFKVGLVVSPWGAISMVGLGILSLYNENRFVNAIGGTVIVLGIAELMGIIPKNFILVHSLALGVLGMSAILIEIHRLGGHVRAHRAEGRSLLLP